MVGAAKLEVGVRAFGGRRAFGDEGLVRHARRGPARGDELGDMLADGLCDLDLGCGERFDHGVFRDSGRIGRAFRAYPHPQTPRIRDDLDGGDHLRGHERFLRRPIRHGGPVGGNPAFGAKRAQPSRGRVTQLDTSVQPKVRHRNIDE